MTSRQFLKAHRLLKSEDFTYLKSGSLCLKAPYLIAYVKKSRLQNQETRLGLSVSTKVAKSCKRSRFKRIMRESFRLSDVRSLGFDILFVVSPFLLKKIPDEHAAEQTLRSSLKIIFDQLSKLK